MDQNINYYFDYLHLLQEKDFYKKNLVNIRRSGTFLTA